MDGVEAANRSFVGGVGTANAWRIGAYQTAATGNFDGLIDDVRIYRRAISAAVVQADLAAAVQPEHFAPSVESTSPLDSAEGVSSTATVRATFSEPMQAGSIDAATFVLRDSAGNEVASTVQYVSSTRSAILTPSSPLAGNARYVATVKGGPSGVADLAGNRLGADVSWSFTTRLAPSPILDRQLQRESVRRVRG